MTSKIITLFSASLLLASCDMAAEQLDGQIRIAVVEQCQQMSENLGLAAETVAPVCECSADKFMEGDTAERTNIDRAKIEGIVKACMPNSDTPAADAPVEDINA